MKKRKYIKAHNMPPSGILTMPIIWWLFLDRLDAPAWVFGGIGTLITIVLVAEIWRMFACEAVDLVGNDD